MPATTRRSDIMSEQLKNCAGQSSPSKTHFQCPPVMGYRCCLLLLRGTMEGTLARSPGDELPMAEQVDSCLVPCVATQKSRRVMTMLVTVSMIARKARLLQSGFWMSMT
jgi:hypothetical protein